MKTNKTLREKIEEFLFMNNGCLCDVCIGEVGSKLLTLFKDEMEKVIGGDFDLSISSKILCNCPCKGPFCDTFTHQCDKPNEHYPQRDQATMEVRNHLRASQRQALQKLIEV